MRHDTKVLRRPGVSLMHGIYVDGGWVDARTGAGMEIKNPATLKALETVPACGPLDIERAVAAAHAAQPAWCRTPALERAALLREIGARLHVKRDELAVSMTLGPASRSANRAIASMPPRAYSIATGPPPPPARAPTSLPSSRPSIFRCSLWPPRRRLRLPPVRPSYASRRRRILSPVSHSVVSASSLPKGVINLVTGGADTAAALALHPLVTEMSFTGSSEVACRLQALAPGKQLDLETGSLDAFIVCADADLERAVPGLAWARLMNAGQTCASGRHIYVERAVAAELTERIHQYVGFLDVDDPSRAGHPSRPSDFARCRATGRGPGRACAARGVEADFGGAAFSLRDCRAISFQPTILSDVRPGSAPTREEILGPVITMTPVGDLGEALELGSRAASPLRAWIYTGDPEAAASRARARAGGTFFINEPSNPTGGPFGGLRFGRIRAALGEEPVRIRSGDSGSSAPRRSRLNPGGFPMSSVTGARAARGLLARGTRFDLDIELDPHLESIALVRSDSIVAAIKAPTRRLRIPLSGGPWGSACT